MKKNLTRLSLLFLPIVIVALLILCVGCQGQDGAEKPKPKFAQSTIDSKILNTDWTYEVYLPPEYDPNSNTEYPVVYFLHGACGSSNNLRTIADMYPKFDNLIKNKEVKSFICVSFDGLNSYYVDRKFKMESAIINELMPTIEKKYKVSKAKENTFIGGFSMGGYGSARLSLKYPEKFAGAFLLSPVTVVDPTTDPDSSLANTWGLFKDQNGQFDKASWTENHPFSYFGSYTSKNSPVKYYVATGEADKSVYISNVNEFVDKLNKIADVKYVTEKDAAHNFDFWTPQIQEAVKYLIGK